MSNISCLFDTISSGASTAHDHPVWGTKPPTSAGTLVRLLEQYNELFADSDTPRLFSAPGRTEISGNHTDHQHGHVLCGSVDLDMLACAAPNG